MKYLLYKLLFGLIVAVIFVGCTGDSSEQTKYLSVSKAPINSLPISTNQTISLEFSSDLNISSITSNSAYIRDIALNHVGVNLKIDSVSLNKITFIPYQYLKPSTKYTIVITTQVKSLKGLSLSKDYIYPFTTAADAVDESPILIEVQKPLNNSTVDPKTNISLQFNKLLSPEAQFTTNNLIKVTSSAGTVVDGTLSFFNSVVTFDPTLSLDFNTTYSVELDGNITDMYGNTFYQDMNWSFNTSSSSIEMISGLESVYIESLAENRSIIRAMHTPTSNNIVAITAKSGIDFFALTELEDGSKTLESKYSFSIDSQINSMEIFENSYMIIGTMSDGVYILGVDDTNVSELSHITSTTSIYGVLAGMDADSSVDRAYAVGPEHGLEVFSVDESKSLSSLSKIEMTDAIPLKVVSAIDSLGVRRVYVADYEKGVWIFDENGALLTTTKLNGSTRDVAILQDSSGIPSGVLATNSLGSISILNLNGTVSSTLEMLSPANDISVYYSLSTSTKVYISDSTNGLYIYNNENGVLILDSIISSTQEIISTDILHDAAEDIIITLDEGANISVLFIATNDINESNDSVIPEVPAAPLVPKNFSMTLDVNESSTTSNWKTKSTSPTDAIATINTQGSYGTFVISGDMITYTKTVETNSTDSAILNIDGNTTQIIVSLDSLYWIEVSGGSSHTAAIKSDGTLWSWGYNPYGQLGDGTQVNKLVPTQEASKGTSWSSVSTGSFHTIAIKSDGTLWSWGYNFYGQLGDGTQVNKLVPTQLDVNGIYSSLSAGAYHNMVLKSDGTLWSWGFNSFGQVGDGTTANKLVPTQEDSNSTWLSVASGYSHTVGIKSDGTLWSWGYNYYGQLGDGTYGFDTNKSVPIQEDSNSTNWSTASAGSYHSSAIKSDGTLWSWGRNENGQLGDGTIVNKSSPTQEDSNSTNWSNLSSGDYYTLATKYDNNTLWSWGQNWNGQLGDGTVIDRSVPTQEDSNSTNWSNFSAGGSHSTAIKSDGTLWSWGYNGWGQLGNGTTDFKLVPAQESSKSVWLSLSPGEIHSVAIKDDNTLWSWGNNYYGQLGDSTTINRFAPTQENSNSGWQGISAGDNHTVAINSDGTLWSWGYNLERQLGDGTTTDKYIPTQIDTNNTWLSISAGGSHTLAIYGDNTLWSWGDNSYGQLGDGTITYKSVPTQADANPIWSSISAGTFHSVAIKNDGTLWSWGYNFAGQLANGSSDYSSHTAPIQEDSNSTNWSGVSAGYAHTAAIKSDGTLWSWGFNSSGQVGDGTTTNKLVPTQEDSNSTNWSTLSAGYYHTLAIKSDGTLWSWGSNGSGALGDGTKSSRLAPVQEVSASTDWLKVSAGAFHSLAIKNDGTLWSWGSSYNGQLGYGTDNYSPKQPQAR